MGKPRQEKRRNMEGNQPVIYTTRHLPSGYRGRMRILAALREQTMEAVLNTALAIGLRKLEEEQKLRTPQR